MFFQSAEIELRGKTAEVIYKEVSMEAEKIRANLHANLTLLNFDVVGSDTEYAERFRKVRFKKIYKNVYRSLEIIKNKLTAISIL